MGLVKPRKEVEVTGEVGENWRWRISSTMIGSAESDSVFVLGSVFGVAMDQTRNSVLGGVPLHFHWLHCHSRS